MSHRFGFVDQFFFSRFRFLISVHLFCRAFLLPPFCVHSQSSGNYGKRVLLLAEPQVSSPSKPRTHTCMHSLPLGKTFPVNWRFFSYSIVTALTVLEMFFTLVKVVDDGGGVGGWSALASICIDDY